MKVAIFGKQFNESFSSTFEIMFNILEEKGLEIYIYKAFYDFLGDEYDFVPSNVKFFSSHEDISPEIDFFFSVGGDGTFLEAASIVRRLNIPIVGINSGRLGFLADIAQGEIAIALDNLFNGNYRVEERTLLEMNSSCGTMFSEYNYALNEFTVHKRDSAAMITIHTYVNGEYLNSYWADGLLICTPTGSTAYSLSVGGPILMPNNRNFVITPISPHNLTVRPIVVTDDVEIKLRVEGRSSNYLASLDSHSEVFDSNIELTVKKADFTIKVIKLFSHSFYATLRGKLMWGADRRN